MNEAMSKPVLIILHQEHSTPGRIGRLLTERGLSLDIRRPRCGDPLPEWRVISVPMARAVTSLASAVS